MMLSVSNMETDALVAQLDARAKVLLDALDKELSSISVGRATPGILNGIQWISGDGTKKRVNHVAGIVVQDQRSLKVIMYDISDKTEINLLANAISESPVGLSVQRGNPGELIVRLPDMTTARKAQLQKAIHQAGEDTKQHIRLAKQTAVKKAKAITVTKKDKGKENEAVVLSQDAQKQLLHQLEEAAKKYTAILGKTVEQKCRELG